ncbi:MAG TPA: sigma factor [Verrucomicrobiae bacterium]|nr:sigma factor [Verrucomicrobiae bacterium]
MIKAQETPPKPEQIALGQGLFLQHTPKLRGFEVTICPDLSLVDDLVRETFMTVTEKAGQFVAGTNFMAWACTIARNKVMSACRRQKRHTLLSPEVLESVCACAPDEDALAPTLPHERGRAGRPINQRELSVVHDDARLVPCPAQWHAGDVNSSNGCGSSYIAPAGSPPACCSFRPGSARPSRRPDRPGCR